MNDYEYDPENGLQKVFVDLPDGDVVLRSATFRRLVPYTHIQEHVCTPLRLPVPSASLWHSFEKYIVRTGQSDSVRTALHEVVADTVQCHIRIVAPPRERGWNSSPRVIPVPANQTQSYLLCYGFTLSDTLHMSGYWQDCRICGELHRDHIEDFCPTHLGERFLTGAPEYVRTLTTLADLHRSLPSWLDAQAESIYAQVLERVTAPPKAVSMEKQDDPGTNAYGH